MAKIYYDKDAKLDVLKGKTIAVIGFGAQGHAQAQNLKDSGLKVIVAELPGTPNYEKAKKAGMEIVTTEEAAKRGDYIQILIPDEHQADAYKKSIEPNLKKGKVLGFSHGFNIRFKQIVPPKDVDIVMVAPKGPGVLVRKQFEDKKGVPCLVAIEQNASGKALDMALAYAKGIGGARAGVIETTFTEETETDLFGEQCVLCGGATSLVKAGFETLVEAGYQPEIAYFECLHELKLIVDLMYEKGIYGMRQAISNTAKYGDVTVGPIIVDKDTKARMKKALKRVTDGSFAKEWIEENKSGRKKFNELLGKDKEHIIEKVGAKLREMMPWLKK